jgi:hypothetical protein
MISGPVRIFILSGVCAAVAACTAQGPTLNAQAEQMELALLDCKSQLGLAGQTKTQVSFDGGTAQARVVPFDQITAPDAARINACASGAAVLDDGLMVVPLQASTVTARAPEPVGDALRTQSNPGECLRGQSGLFGGTSYCFGVLE